MNLDIRSRAQDRAKAFFRRYWQDALIWRDRLKLSEEAFHLVLAGLVGMIGGLTYTAFDWFNELLQWTLLGRQGDIIEIARSLNPSMKVIVPVMGGLLAGCILYFGLRLIGNPGLSNLMEVVVAGDGRLPLRSSILKALSSLVSISTGASIGREGLLIQLTSALASKLGVLAKWPPYRLRLLVACGAASGIAAACNAPIAGAVFAAQIVLGNFSMTLFAPLVFASVVATMISRRFVGAEHHFAVDTTTNFDRLTQLPWFILLGVLAGLVGALFMKSLRLSEALFRRTNLPLYGRMALAGLIVGFLTPFLPQVWGNGQGATNMILGLRELDAFPMFLIWLFLAKFLATTICIGSGTVGGVFTPTLLLGAALGGIIGSALQNAGWVNLPVSAFALVGMGSMLAATTHSALLAMILVFELSLNYGMMPALMLACAIAMIVARAFEKESVYTEPLRRKGLNLNRESAHLGAASEKTVADLMRDPVRPVRENATFREIADRFLTGPNNFLPVVNDVQRLLGVVSLHDMKEYLNAGYELNSVIAFDIMRPPPPCLTPAQKLADVLPTLLASELKNVPVISDEQDKKLIGRVARSEALGMISEVIAARSSPRL